MAQPNKTGLVVPEPHLLGFCSVDSFGFLGEDLENTARICVLSVAATAAD